MTGKSDQDGTSFGQGRKRGRAANAPEDTDGASRFDSMFSGLGGGGAGTGGVAGGRPAPSTLAAEADDSVGPIVDPSAPSVSSPSSPSMVAGGEDPLGKDSGHIDVIIPRVAIDVFCSTPDFANVMRATLADRRLQRAVTHLAMGGVEAAEKRYATKSAANLIIIESADGGFQMFGELERLAAVCDENSQVIAAGPSNDIGLYRELLQQGVAEYLVTPCAPVQMIEAIASMFADPDAAPAARVITVFGAKGGVGASVLAHNLAWSIASHDQTDTVLVDLDVEFGTAGLDFNLDVKHSIVDALSDADELDEVKLGRLLYPHGDHLKLLPAPGGVRSSHALDEAAVTGLIDTVRYTCDTVVIDAPHGWGDGVRSALRQADDLVLVGTPDLACLRNLKSVLEWAAAERENDRPPRLVMNQCAQPKRADVPMKDIVDVLGATIDVVIPFDGQLFTAAMNNGQMLSEINSASPIVRDIDGLGQVMLGKEQTDRTARASSILSLNITSLAKAIGVGK